MKSKLTVKILILITLFMFSLVMWYNCKSIFFSPKLIHRSFESEIYKEFDEQIVKISTFSERIHIDNNWTDAKLVGICSGEGTYSNPYLIEDLIIESSGPEDCILIENSNVYFIIKNCCTFGSEDYPSNDGIRLNYVTHSKLINNNCSSHQHGIILYNCEFNIIFGNNINNSYLGIGLLNGDHNNISGNVVKHSDYGISLREGSCGSGEICISEENTIYNNIVINNGVGIAIYGGTDNKVLENKISDNNGDGLFLYTGYYNEIAKNTIRNNVNNGISLSICLYNKILENIINNNERGVYLSQSNYNNITKNDLSGNNKCWEEDDCNGNIFVSNLCGIRPVIRGYNFFFIANFLITILFILRRKKKI